MKVDRKLNLTVRSIRRADAVLGQVWEWLLEPLVFAAMATALLLITVPPYPAWAICAVLFLVFVLVKLVPDP